VAGSRMRDGLEVYTDDSRRLESALDRRFDKSVAVEDRAPTENRLTSSQETSDQSQSFQQDPVQQELGQGR
jgi:hypothetical protein